ncbi:class I SAM-dependent DNA methyltransferase [Pseudonocardia nantongensis]|uniref:class I SAM-dependent DNA methyltransferase n=1 Tax=Pseudonocardia nantongensis TaxID=1181885 RepID=UPI00397A3D0C
MSFPAMDFDPFTSFGPQVAAHYDDHPRGDEKAAVARLAALAAGGPVCELAIGTGRLALPLAAAGIRVDGVEQSAAMIERLQAKPGGGEPTVVHGDMAEVDLPGRYRLVFVAFNSLMNLTTQDAQVRCVTNAARHLDDEGVFVVENVCPDPMYRLERRDGVDQYCHAAGISTTGVHLDVGRYDRVTQRVDKCHVRIGEHGITRDTLALRYVWPSELDLMARLAGLELRERHGGWSDEPFTADSRLHVSVYGRRS